MARVTLITHKEFVEMGRKTHGGNFNYSKVPSEFPKSEKVEIVCPEHGSFWHNYYQHELYGCRKCSAAKKALKYKGKNYLKTEKFKLKWQENLEKALRIHENKYSYAKTKPSAAKEFVTITCPVHGDFQQRWSSHLQGYGCHECFLETAGKWNIVGSKTLEEKFLREARELWGDEYDLGLVKEGDFTSENKYKTRIRCRKCGSVFKTDYTHFITKGRGCLKCRRERNSIKQAEKSLVLFKRKTKELYNGAYKYPYINKELRDSAGSFSIPITITCPVHGNIQQLAYNHLSGHSCSLCKRSYAEQRLGEYIKRLMGGEEVEFNNRTLLEGKELDIYVPSRKLAIEYCGGYWHSGDKVSADYHAFKQRECERQGITLITVFDSDMLSEVKREIVYKRLAYLLGNEVSCSHYARKLKVEEIKAEEAREFLSSNHFQGFSPAKVYLALRGAEGIEAVLTMGKPRFSKKAEWELLRYANNRNCRVVGGLSRLFTHFVRKYNPSSVISYADLCWGSGNSYVKLGFHREKNSPPNFWYQHISGGYERISRIKAWKSNLPKLLGIETVPVNKTQEEIMREHGYIKIYGCGNAVWIWRKEETENGA